MNKNKQNKVVYFDEETIANILIKEEHGLVESTKTKTKNLEAGIQAEIKLNVSFLMRLKFLVTSQLSASYILQENTTLSSTILSQFEERKTEFRNFEGVKLDYVDMSLTAYKIALMFAKASKDQLVENGLDVNELEKLFDNFEGYYTFKYYTSTYGVIYFRFNMNSFLSNYKISEIKNTILNVSTIYIGEINKSDFRVMETVEKITNSLELTYVDSTFKAYLERSGNTADKNSHSTKKIKLYDIVYAETSGEKDE